MGDVIMVPAGPPVIGPFTGEYAFLSNFSPHGILYGAVWFPTVEHFFQAAKAPDLQARDWVITAPTPGEAKRRGRRLDLPGNWDQLKRGVMLQGVLSKFMQHPELRNRLIETDGASLEEVNTWGDRYWGTAGGQGENWLGRILMQVREVLA